VPHFKKKSKETQENHVFSLHLLELVYHTH